MRVKNGGQVIGAGGYGCVFKPALKCEGSNNRTTGISKMLSNKDAEVEWKEISNVKSIILKIPNNHKYFLLGDMNICKPNLLSEDDKKNMEICNSLSRIGLNAKNINNNLSKVKIINMPDGGKDIHEIFSKNNVKFQTLNASLIDLLKNGIIPMNNLGLFHNDLKGENILYKDEHSRIIDWGLASIQKGNKIPSIITDRVIQFNLPYSNILFNNYFKKWYPNVLKMNNIYKNSPFIMEQLELVAINWFELWKQIGGEGHITYINNFIILPIFANYDVRLKKNENLILLFFSKYIAKILYEFTNFDASMPIFKDEEYYNNVYKYNCDVWGFIMSYSPLIRNNYFRNEVKNSLSLKYYIKNVSNLLLKYCFNSYYSARKININELVNDLENIKTLGYNILHNNQVVQILTSSSNRKSANEKIEKPKVEITDKKSKISHKKLSPKRESSKQKSPTRKRKRCPNGSRKNSKGECIPYK